MNLALRFWSGEAQLADNIIRGRVTKQAVDRLEIGQTLRDTELKGFGVRRQKGVPSYFLQRKINGRLRWFTIGVHGSPWTPEAARREAMNLMVTAASGEDPMVVREALRAKPTFKEAAEQFMASHGVKLKPRTREEYQRIFKLHLNPAFGSRLVDSLGKPDVTRFHAGLAATPAGANFTLAVLSKLLRWCEDMGYRPEHSNPCRGTKKYRQAKRERFLSRDEFARLGQVLAEVETDRSVGLFAVGAVRLLLLTGARLNEIVTLQWRHVDLERRLLLLSDSKTGQKPIRLSEQAAAVLAGLPRIKGNPYVIVGMREGQHLVNLQKPWRLIRSRAGLDDVRVHDLRHSFASVGAASGGSLPMIGALLGHRQPQTTARYAHLADDPLRRLNQDVGDAIAAAMNAQLTPSE